MKTAFERLATLGFYVLDDDGTVRQAGEGPEDAVKWATSQGHNRQIAYDVRGQFEISTVFLGIDYSHGLGPRRKYFETMIFAEDHFLDQWLLRYETLAEAKAGHHFALHLVQLARKGPRRLKKALPKVLHPMNRLMLGIPWRKPTKDEERLRYILARMTQ